jgi:CYTH domain-containing protein
MIELERRFLVDELPRDLGDASRIVQGYLMTQPAAVRVRRRDGACTLTVKTGAGLARTEIERAITTDEFEALWEVATDLRIEKRRFLVALDGGHTAELDLFDGELAGHRLVEVEFASADAAAAFHPPAWFGREVTDDGRYTNAALARHGWPAD